MGKDNATTKASKITHGSPENSLVTKLSGDVQDMMVLVRYVKMRVDMRYSRVVPLDVGVNLSRSEVAPGFGSPSGGYFSQAFAGSRLRNLTGWSLSLQGLFHGQPEPQQLRTMQLDVVSLYTTSYHKITTTPR